MAIFNSKFSAMSAAKDQEHIPMITGIYFSYRYLIVEMKEADYLWESINFYVYLFDATNPYENYFNSNFNLNHYYNFHCYSLMNQKTHSH
jgi:hypothetical protein